MNRRQYLAALGSAAMVGTAGCNSDSATSTDSTGDSESETETGQSTATGTAPAGPATFDDISIDGPDSVTVNSDASFTVSVTNTGGERGEFTDTLSAAGGFTEVEESVTIQDVPPGETESRVLGPYAFEAVQSGGRRRREFGNRGTRWGGVCRLHAIPDHAGRELRNS